MTSDDALNEIWQKTNSRSPFDNNEKNTENTDNKLPDFNDIDSNFEEDDQDDNNENTTNNDIDINEAEIIDKIHKPEIDKGTGKKIIEIGLRFRIDQLAEISTVDQTYHALCSLDMDWTATLNDVINHKKNPRDYTPEKVPRIDPKNFVVKETSYKPWANGNLVKLVEKNGIYYNLRRIEYDCVWSEPFEVNHLHYIFLLFYHTLTLITIDNPLENALIEILA